MPSRFRDLLRFLPVVVAALAVVLVPLTAKAGAKADAESAIAASTATVERLRADANFKREMDPYLARARAVMIVPRFYKGAFFIGGAYGNGLLTVRDDSGLFSPPAFVRMVGGSLGLQFGGQEARMIFMIMTDAGLDAVLKDKFKFGAGAGLSFATFGANIEGSTTSAAGADIIAFAHSAGAFGGGAFEGTMIEPRQDWNEAVYGAGALPRGILFDRRYPAPDLTNELYHAMTVNTGAPVDGRQPAAQPMSQQQPAYQDQPAVTPAPTAPVQSQPLTPPPSSPPPSSAPSSSGAPSSSSSYQAVPSYDAPPAPAQPEPAPRRSTGPLLIAPVETAPLPPAR